MLLIKLLNKALLVWFRLHTYIKEIMMTIDLKEVGSGFKRTSLNENFVDIEDAINNDLLWRDGSQPMAGSLDMNSERIINLPDALTDQEPLTLGQASTLIVSGSLPSQTGEAGKYLTTDGTAASWGEGLALPNQSGNSGKFLSTDGTDASWQSSLPGEVPDQSGNSGKFLSTDGTNTSWQDVAASSSSSYDNVTEMFNGSNVVGEVYGAGGTFWRVDSISVPMTIANYTALTDVNIAAFGALQDGSNSSPALQAAIEYASPLRLRTLIQGNYSFGATITLQYRTDIYAGNSILTVPQGIGSLFYADGTAGTVDRTRIEGGQWIGEGDTKLADITFLKVEGAEGQSVWRTYLNHLQINGFDVFMDSDYHRDWNIHNSHIRARSGVIIRRENAECQLTDSMLYGNDATASDTVGIEIGADTDTAAHSASYPEGLRFSNLGIDNFDTGILLREGYDIHFNNLFVGGAASQPNSQLRHCLKVEPNTGGNSTNFLQAIHFDAIHFSRGNIEFVSHAAPPTVVEFRMDNIVYKNNRPVIIGNFWHGIIFSNWLVSKSNAGNDVGFICQYGNENCTFSDIRFDGAFTRLIQVNGNASYNTTIDNVWCDEYVDAPFYVETAGIKITNSMAPDFPVTSVSQGGQVLVAQELNSATVSNYCAILPTLRFKVGAMVQISLHGRVTSSTSSGKVEIRPTTSSSGNIESLANGTGWDSKFIEIDNGVSRIDASYIFKETTGDTVNFVVQALDGDIDWDFHSYLVVRYI